MFNVYDNNKPATLPDSRHKCWHNNSFTTLNEAVEYANDWLGCYGPQPVEELLEGLDYSGMGDTIKIVEE